MKHIKQQNLKITQDTLLAPNLVGNMEFFRTVWDVVECGILVLDVLDDGADYRFAAFNPAFQKMSLLPTETLLGKTLKESLPDEMNQIYNKRYSECVRTGKTISFEEQFWLDGKQTWWSLSVAPVHNKDSLVHQLIITVKNITKNKVEIEKRKLIEQALQGSEEYLRNQEQFLRSIYDGAQNSFIVVDVEDGDFNFAGWNKAAEALSGIPREQIRGKRFEDIFNASEANKLRTYYQQCVQQRQVISFEDSILYESQTFWLLTQLNPLFDKNGNVYRVVATCVDISERKRIEEALQISEARFRGLVENASDAIFIYSAENKFTYVSPRITDILGHQVSDILGKDNTFYLHDDDVVQVKNFTKYVLETGNKKEGLEFRVQHQNGKYIWVTCSISAIKDKQGNITAIQGILRDINETKAAQKALDSLQARLEYLISESPGVIYSCKASGDYGLTFISPNSAAVLGYDAEYFMQNPNLWKQKIHPDDFESFFKTLPILFEVGHTTKEYRFLHQDGNYRWIHDEAKLVKDKNGIPLEVIGHSFDITQRRVVEENLQYNKEELQQKAEDLEQALQKLQQTQAQLVQSEKMSSLGQLVAGVAHEINNPVSFIYSNLEPAKNYINDILHLIFLYQKYYPDPSETIAEEIEAIDLEFVKTDLPKLLTSMKMGADRIKQIVLSLRNFSRMDEAEYKGVNIHEGIDSTLIILEHRIKATTNRPAINIVKQYAKLPLVECYAGQLNQVFMNILSNALDALEERDLQRSLTEIEALPSCINITTENINNQYISIRISDNGCGIPDSIQKRLFDPFFTTKPIGKGTGMGLSISYQIITEKHNGNLQCISSPGQGTTFAIQVPIKQWRQ
jgi:PAS domain S-box-containing protein